MYYEKSEFLQWKIYNIQSIMMIKTSKPVEDILTVISAATVLYHKYYQFLSRNKYTFSVLRAVYVSTPRNVRPFHELSATVTS